MQGETVMVTGGHSGIGFAVARRCVEAGARVILAARNEERLQAAAQRLGGGSGYRVVDVRDEEAVRETFEAIDALDHLVTAAAGFAPGSLLDADRATFEDWFASKFWGQYWCVRYAAPRLAGGGSVVLFSGQASRHPPPGLGMASCINGAVEGLGRSLAQELAPVRVNVVSPGMTATEMFDFLPEQQRRELFDTHARTVPVGRVGTPEDAAEAAMYLLRCGYASGTVVEVDGGEAIAPKQPPH